MALHLAKQGEYFHNTGTDDQSSEDNSKNQSFQHVATIFRLTSEKHFPSKTLEWVTLISLLSLMATMLFRAASENFKENAETLQRELEDSKVPKNPNLALSFSLINPSTGKSLFLAFGKLVRFEVIHPLSVGPVSSAGSQLKGLVSSF